MTSSQPATTRCSTRRPRRPVAVCTIHWNTTYSATKSPLTDWQSGHGHNNSPSVYYQTMLWHTQTYIELLSECYWSVGQMRSIYPNNNVQVKLELVSSVLWSNNGTSIYRYAPGHGLSLQACASWPLPGHWSPPWSRPKHILVRLCMPPPQDIVQASQSDQAVHWPSTEKGGTEVTYDTNSHWSRTAVDGREPSEMVL